MIVEPGKTYIGKMRATSNERDTLALRMRLSSMLSTMDLNAPGLPRSAIVCIRKFHDPLPGSLRVQPGGTPSPYTWEHAVQASLKRLVEHALYPARDAVPLNAEAVIFADQPEMLACLARDWCVGNSSGCWWWQGLSAGKDIGQLLVPTWLNAPEYIPAALQCLAKMGQAKAFVRTLSGNDAHALLLSIVRSFGLYELQFLHEAVAKQPESSEPMQASRPPQATFSPPGGMQHVSIAREAVAAAQPSGHTRASPENPPLPQAELRHAPWQPWVPESSGELTLERQCLLGIGLMLARAPAAVRTSAFALAVLQWRWMESLSPGSDIPPIEKSSSMGDVPAGQERTQSSSPDPAEHPHETPVFSNGEMDARGEFLSIARDTADTTPGSMQIATNASASAEVVASARSIEPSRESSQLPAAKTLSPSLEVRERDELRPYIVDLPPLSGEPPPEAHPLSISGAMLPIIEQEQPGTVALLATEIETELGGLFYLINLGLFLNLYGDFTTPLQSGISLSIWDFIALLGQQLLGVATTRAGTGPKPTVHKEAAMQDDPIWLFLAQMAGRGAQEPAGKDFDAPHSWRVPADWLLPFPEEGTWCWDRNNGRLQVHHPEQFLVLDVPLDGGNPLEQVMRELQEFTELWHAETKLMKAPLRYGEVELVDPSPTQIERWLMPYVRVRVQRALGLDSADDIARVLCKHTARIILTATHLDIILSLATLPIEVRLSGLDRNPGWVPAAGHFITFHFE